MAGISLGTAILGSAIVGGGAAALSAGSQSRAIREGSEVQAQTSQQNLQLQRELADEQRADLAPWRNLGEMALDRLWEGVDSGAFTMDDWQFEADPGYQFRLQEDIDARDKSAAARGRLLSGAQMRALERYGQDFASNEYARAYDREANERIRNYNILSGLSSMGQAAAARQAGSSSQLASTSSNILTNLGLSQNQAAQAQGAARASAYQGIGNSVNQAAQNWLLYRMTTPATVTGTAAAVGG